MKKTFKSILGIAILVGTGVTAFNAQNNDTKLSSLIIENIEAIAHEEGGNGNLSISCAYGTRCNYNEVGAVYKLFCNPCGSSGYMHVDYNSRCNSY